MANKVKDIKKKGRRLKRSIRKTLGTLFLVSALVVAAIPVDYLQADEIAVAEGAEIKRPNTERKDMKVSIKYLDDTEPGKDWSTTTIPDVKQDSFHFGSDKTNIYTSEDLVFDFAVSNIRGNGRFAAIVGYHNQNQLNNVGDRLTIPKTLDAYAPYGSESGSLNDSFSCAIGGTQGELLFYRTVNRYTYDDDGNITNTIYKYSPCLFQDKNTWIRMEWNAETNPNSSLYYVSGLTEYMQEGYKWEEGVPTKVLDDEGQESDLTWVPANETMRERFKDIPVSYIANQYVASNDEIKDVVGASTGIFSTATVSTLKVEPNLIGIGKYAFAGTHIKTVELSDSVVEIGSHAFEGCDGLTSFNIGENALNVVIGDYAFANCKALRQFDARNVQKIGDAAFWACDLLQNVNLLGTGTSGALSKIGYYAFAYCIGLEEMVLPSTYTESDLLVSTFEGCTRLGRIYGTGETISFNVAEDDYYPFEKFKSSIASSFYFEGPQGSALENTVIPEYFVYKYSEQEVYKKRMPDKASQQPDGTYSLNAIFEVTRLGDGTGDGTGEITDVQIEPGLSNLEIPDKVGKLDVVEIGQGGFRGNSNLKNVIIPAKITNIRANAFADCPNLENVFFDNPWTLAPIGENAFKTNSTQLNFISGTPFKEHGNSIEDEAFKYAMGNDNVFNNNLSHITYYTGWPSNLVVVNDSGKVTLVEYPTFAELSENTLNSYYYKPEVAEGYKKAALSVGNEALGAGDSSEGTKEDKSAIKDAVENIVIPAGIDVIAKDLFKNGEAKEKTKVEENGADAPQKKLTVYGLDAIDDNAFEGAEYLTTVALSGKTKSIGSYAFKDCDSLSGVSVTAPVDNIGTAPFIGCNKLSNVSFGEETQFTCDKSIIYKVDGEVKTALVEYLNGRDEDTAEVGRDETAGITEVYPEAFKNTNVRVVDLRDASRDFKKLTESTFQNTLNLQDVYLPVSCDTIGEDAFTDSAIRHLYIFNTACWLDKDRFKDTDGDGKTNLEGMYIHCPPQNAACTAFANENTKAGAQPLEGTFYVRFWGYNDETGKVDKLIEGYGDENAKLGANFIGKEPPKDEVPEMNGYKFVRWDPNDRVYGNVTENLDIYAVYPSQYVVKFYDKDDWVTPLSTVRAFPGDPVNPPIRNKNGDLIFAWKNRTTGEVVSSDDFVNMIINQDMEFIAEYDDSDNPGNQTPTPNPGGSTPTPGPGGSTPTPGPGGSTPTPGPGGSTPTPTPNPGGTVPRPDGTYSLEVFNGSGSGHYVPGSQIVITADPAPEGQRFAGWDVSPASTVVTDKTRVVTIVTMPNSDVAILAKYESKSGGDDDDSKLYNLEVSGGSGSGSYPAGAQVIITANAAPENQEFSGWDVSPAETVVTDKTRTSTIITMPESDVAAIAKYNSPPEVTPSPAPTQEPTPTPAALHSLIVHNGSGSGSYVAGAQIVIVANDPAAGQEFTGWTVSPDNTVISDKTLSGAVITMPDNDVAVIANFKTKATGSGNSTGSGNNANTNNSGNSTNNNSNNSGSNSGTSTNRPSSGTSTNTATSNRGGTTVVIDKNGLSNTGVVSATVNGSSDNFTIKITESSEATAAVLNALLAEYGSVDNIKYFPMDISLYDSTGNTKITDTTGLSVSITLPLPDSLITYAGNNKVAGVVNDRLDKLTPRFTTINGVSCITFTAEHFSPYVIYVDVANLSNGTVTDATPTTGDGIHPKWFLSIGLACLSFVMFMMKDGGRAPRKKQKVKVRA